MVLHTEKSVLAHHFPSPDLAEVLGANTFLGGAIMDAGLLPPPGKRIPFYQGGGRVLQMLQARCAIRGWIIACLPLGGQDDVGNGYILSLIESFMMSLYERAHGATGEGALLYAWLIFFQLSAFDVFLMYLFDFNE